jgi:multicomponent Na+:H+ antiporter subunit D
MGAVLHIAAHSVSKITLFFAAGAIYTAAHKTNVSQLDGIGRRMPVTMAAFAVGALSLMGIPPSAGFVSKWYIVQGAFSAELVLPAIVLLASTLLNAAYFMPIVYAAFFRAPAAGEPVHGEAPWPSVLALAVTAGLTVAFFFVPGLPLSLAAAVAGRP